MKNRQASTKRSRQRGSAEPRIALIAGASGLVGHALLPLLLAGKRYGRVHALVRRAVPGIEAGGKLKVHTVDFERLPGLPEASDMYIALGTTIRAAGSKASFRRVDLDFVVNTAKAGRAAGATRLAVVSALGASARSHVFYNRVKGEMEDAITLLGYESIVIARPSLLLGDRAALGQPIRGGEAWTARLLGPVSGLVPKAVRPIPARAVAAAMLSAMLEAVPGVRVLKSGAMQDIARSGHGAKGD